jgi:hypothetical protein
VHKQQYDGPMHSFVYPLKKLSPYIFQNTATIRQWKPAMLRLDGVAPTSGMAMVTAWCDGAGDGSGTAMAMVRWGWRRRGMTGLVTGRERQ